MNESTGRSPKASQADARTHAPHAALMIDFDNVTMGIRSDLQNQLRRLLDSDIIKGKVSVQRAYADWRRYPQYIVPLSEASIDLIFAPAFGANKKNATDIRLAIDALELVFTRPEIGTFILLSGDSDFSALVLKLKEYGKFVIGVGIRESSSDLLVQNCDEYYSYSELTGLAKEGEVEHVRRDPWELVVQAVQQMRRDNDVMRSDRLKQVMQTIDPNFEEKDVGYNRFSKFVMGAADRGLLTLTKMENGQFAIDLGPNANVPPAEEAAVAESAEKPRPDRARKRPSPRRRGERTARSEVLTLSEGFELLKQALMILGAVESQWTEPDRARAQMVELYGEESDPVFSARRFERMLRQARDANLIELTKDESGSYKLRLDPAALLVEEVIRAESEPTVESASVAEKTAEAVPAPPQPRRRRISKAREKAAVQAAPDRTGEREAPETEKAPSTDAGQESRQPSRGPSARKEPRPQRAARSPRPPRSPGASRAAKPPEETQAKPSPTARPEPRAHEDRRNPRFRKGSRGSVARPARPSVDESPPRADESPPSESPQPQRSRTQTGARSLGVRRGSRGNRSTPASSPTESEPAKEAEVPAPRAKAQPPEREAARERPPQREQVAVSQIPADAMEESDQDSGGLLRRMSSVFQRAVRGKIPKGEEADED